MCLVLSLALIGKIFQARIGIGNVGFCGEGKTKVPSKKELQKAIKTRKKYNLQVKNGRMTVLTCKLF